MGARKKIGIGFRFVLLAVCYFLAAHYSEDVQDAARIAVVSFANGGVPVETAESICEEERRSGQDQESGQDQNSGRGQANGQDQSSGQGQVNGQDQEQGQGAALSLCFWHEQENMQFSCKETGQTVQATGLLTEGDPGLVARECGILAWQEKGCVMDTTTAQKLFGTRQANGQTVWCGGEAYPVYGSFDSLERTVVLRTESGSMAENSAGGSADTSAAAPGAALGLSDGEFSDAGYDHLSLRASEGANVKTEAEQLLMRCGLSGDVADFVFPGVVCGNLLLALPILLAVGLLRTLWGCLRAERRQGSIACAVMLAATVAALFFMLRNYVQIPDDMIPTRWSDFSFWPQWWERQKANLLQILGGAQGEPQLEALWSFGRSIACNFLSITAGVSLLHSVE